MAINSIIGLDVGEKRIGIARANAIARISVPLVTINNDQSFGERFQDVLDEYQPDILVVGLPRNMSGLETAQTEYSRAFSQQNLIKYNIPIVFQDETLSSSLAESRLKGKNYTKADIDAYAAAIIIEDYLETI